ncbi:hypothetical protein [Salipiger mucosus]|uniref:Uncharacterized protein n=1 Tax=Salipiger mucosus DSM 16094 TaxID=1123237 RepID=S9RS21_9RHOB|nr:hypothetical protein [Salipiger mucosus]EPX76774.1 hypothetical protein Salmuc_04660 [Salipiger mucosus DSM 16094]
MSDHQFFSDCVGWPKPLVSCPGGLCDCVDAEDEITIERFMEEVDLEHFIEMTHMLGYTGPTPAFNDPDHPQHNPDGLPSSMTEDWHVEFCKSELFGRQVFYFKHSGIEHVYVPSGWTPSVGDIDWTIDDDCDADAELPGLAI